MEAFLYVVSFSSISFLLSETMSALETHLHERSNPCTNRFILSMVFGLRYLFLVLSFLFSIPYHAIHDIHSHYLWKRVSRMVKTAYKVGITDAYYLHHTDAERKLNARRYYVPENEDYYEFHFGFQDKAEELHYWSWKQETLADAELSEDDLR